MKGISTILNTTFEETGVVEKEIKKLETKKETHGRLTIEDKEFLRSELMDLISSTKFTLQLIEDELRRPPLKATLVEAHSMLNREMAGYLKELRMLNNDVADLEMKQRKQESIDTRKEGSKTTNNVFLLDSKMLDKMIGNAKANNMLDAIEVDFKEDDIK
jgi:hypothetical protein